MTNSDLTRCLALLCFAGFFAVAPPARGGDTPAPAAETAPAPEAKDAGEADGDDAITDAEIDAQKAESDVIARDLSANLKPIYEVGDENGRGPKIKVQAWVNQKDLTYAVGETLAVSLRTDQDAYVTILNVGSSGTTTVLYPNHFQRDAKVKKGTIVRIPGRKQKWEITVGGPVGVDLIKVIASKQPLTLKELQSVASADEKNPVITLGRSGDETAKDLSAQLKPSGADEKEPAFGVRNILVRVKK